MKTITAMTLYLGLCCAAGSANALNRYVGSGAGCTDTNIQSAVDALGGNASSFNTLYISRSLAYTSQDIDIEMPGKSLVIIGVNSCTDTAGSGFTEINGAGGDTDPVFKIKNTDYVEMRNLRVTGGDHELAFKGGGIRFEGAGTLVLQDMQISLNTAGSGGGVAMIETNASAANPANLIIQQNVAISDNNARYDGGGIYLEGRVKMNMLRANSFLQGNNALGQPTGPGGTMQGGHGGGLFVGGDARAFIGSGGLYAGNVNIYGVVHENTARYGGGIAVNGGSAGIEVYQTAAGFPPVIKGNLAEVAGGAIWLEPDGHVSFASLTDTQIVANQAPKGAAIYGETDFGVFDDGSGLYFNYPGDPASFLLLVRCSAGEQCSQVVDNVATATEGAIIHMENEGDLRARSTLFARNSAHHVFDLDDGDGDFSLTSLKSVQITDNTLTGPVFKYRDMDLPIQASTIAGNTIGTSHVFEGSNLKLSRTIVFQPGKTTVSSTSGIALVDNAVNTGSGLPFVPGAFVVTSDPFFVDSGRGDYRLRPHSYMVDNAVPTTDNGQFGTGDGTGDILFNPRSVDLPIVPNKAGPQDIGAHERQNIGNLVRNPGFFTDAADPLRHWEVATSATFSTTDRTGVAGSGSMQISSPLSSVTAAFQCIGVPGPGVLRFTGFARTTQVVNGDHASLRWQLHDNSSTCQTAPSAFAVVPIPTSISGWRAPVQDGVITVSAAQWTQNTSILISLTVDDGNDFGTDVFGRFDDISLTYETDQIFANGFDS
ncbi:MAG: hypothetical protein WBP11_10435 [Dokdonella sp.]